MKASEIRQRFLDFFEARGHAVRPSSPLVPRDDPTLLFVNAGMVQFKKVFLGLEEVPFRRAVTSQKCVRAGGKHNDLEEVGRTARHHTFFEMLGNFSFGDYFKREAVGYAWEFLTEDLGLDPDRLYVTVHHTDDQAEALWQEVTGVPRERIFRLGDVDNFWQMADTGPCGPCSELHYDLRPESGRGDGTIEKEAFVEAGERGEFLELWNLVFMQFDRDEEGELHPLPAPSIDTGAGLERLAAVLQGVDSNYHTDLFVPLLERVGRAVGQPYEAGTDEGTSFRVLADHARAVAFLLADGVFPASEGRGYVLRRILRRAVRHAWLLGRREPTLVEVVEEVIDGMGEPFHELVERRDHILRTTRREEERFLSTIEGGMARFEELAPELSSEVLESLEAGARDAPVISGEEAFRLYDTFGFPLDLTELMARERGYAVDLEGFREALEEQRERSRQDRARTDRAVAGEELAEGWTTLEPEAEQRFVGYDTTELDTEVLALRRQDGSVGLQLRDNPFYVEAGGQVSDSGEVRGSGWVLPVAEIVRVGERVAVLGEVRGELPEDLPRRGLSVHARVDRRTRHDTERNHTATHLLHAALREVLGDHVVQRGSLVAPDRLRFDFAHPSPMTAPEIREVEERVNGVIWEDRAVRVRHMPYDEAVSRGAMALFGEKYADEVRVVEIPDVSMELCGGTHVSHTGEIGLFKLTGESGVAAGTRRIEALTGPGAFRHLHGYEERLREVADALGARPENAARRAEQLLDEKADLEELLAELRREGGSGEVVVAEAREDLGGSEASEIRAVRLKAPDADYVRSYGDDFRKRVPSGIRLVAAELPGDKRALFTFVTDDLIGRGLRADAVVREVASRAGGSGGGRPHMAQAGVGDPEALEEALQQAPAIVLRLAGREDGS